MSELQLKNDFLTRVNKDFFILEEVSGRHLIEQSQMIIDFMIRPRTHLIKQGFDDAWIGVEVKYIKEYKHASLYKLACQALSYSQSEFEIEKTFVRPFFVAMFSNQTFNLQKPAEIPIELRGLIEFLEYANVGWFEFDNKYGWRIGFGTHGYFNPKYGKNKINNLGVKRNIGNVA